MPSRSLRRALWAEIRRLAASFVDFDRRRRGLAESLEIGVGATLAILVLAAMTRFSNQELLMAPFASSCVLLFAQPYRDASQPANIVLGYAVATAVGMLMRDVMPHAWWTVAVDVGVVVALLVALRITHPPAGAMPVIVFFEAPGWGFLFFPVLSGSLFLVLTAYFFHRVVSRRGYPVAKRVPGPPPDTRSAEP